MTVFERNDRLVCDAFRDGEFDSIEAAGEVSETDFFRAIAGKKILAFRVEDRGFSQPPSRSWRGATRPH